MALVVTTLALTSVVQTWVSRRKHSKFVFVLTRHNYKLHHDKDTKIVKGTHIIHRTSRDGGRQFLVGGVAQGGGGGLISDSASSARGVF